MDILTFAIQKGGTGKTTTAAAILHAAADQGRRCLAIDLDPQGQLSYLLGAEITGRGSYGLIEGDDPAGLIQSINEYVDAVPANWGLSTITSGRGSARRLEKALNPVNDDYDLIIIDTPPTAGELQYNALQAATGLIIPLQADIFSLQSLYQITDTARQIQASNKHLEILGIVITQYDGRSTIARQMKDTITQTAQGMGIPCLGVIRSAVTVKEAAAMQQPLFDYAPKSKPAADYLSIYTIITQKER